MKFCSIAPSLSQFSILYSNIDRSVSIASPIVPNTGILISPSRGTGKLKEGVHAYLKRHDRIAKFEPAEKYDGGAGVTVAYPK